MTLRFCHFTDEHGMLNVTCKVTRESGEYPGDSGGLVIEDIEVTDDNYKRIEIDTPDFRSELTNAAIEAF